jgi:uncharacterized protein
MIVKLIIAVLLAWLGYRVYNSYKRLKKIKQSEADTQDMVRCDQCGIHLPASEALPKAGKHYCCNEHLPGGE